VYCTFTLFAPQQTLVVAGLSFHHGLYQIEAFPFFKKFDLGGKAQWYYASNVVPDSLTRKCSG
jgi:hypothetical protein